MSENVVVKDVLRTLVISSQIDSKVAYGIVGEIMEINRFDTEQYLSNNKYIPRPIELFINSPGGHVYDGLAIINAINMSETPVVTYGIGHMASMALAIFASGHYRVASKYSRFMYHSISWGMMGNITEHKDISKEMDNLQEMYNDIIFERTKMDKETVDKITRLKKDYYFSPERALELEFADDIIHKVEQTYDIKELIQSNKLNRK